MRKYGNVFKYNWGNRKLISTFAHSNISTFAHFNISTFSHFHISTLFLKSFPFILILLSTLAGCYTSSNPLREQTRLLRKGRLVDDTSYVYSLPYESGRRYRMVQGYFSSFSHRERAALDFKMKRGTKIAAARGGIVIRVKEDGDRGGLNRKYREFGNNVVIEHEDGSRAGYWHLQKDGALVAVGDTVLQGQVIGLSGKTGYAAFPHLHFMVWKSGPDGWQQIPTRFETGNGNKYLRGLRRYRKPM